MYIMCKLCTWIDNADWMIQSVYLNIMVHDASGELNKLRVHTEYVHICIGHGSVLYNTTRVAGPCVVWHCVLVWEGLTWQWPHAV